MLGGFFSLGVDRQYPPTSAREVQMPVSALLARIRRFIPHNNDRHYDEIVRGFGIGALHSPATPMSDQELSRAIAEFLKDSPSAEAAGSFGRRLDPSWGF